MAEDGSTRRKRHGGRTGNARRTSSFQLDQMPWRVPFNPDPPVEPVDTEGVQAIHGQFTQRAKFLGAAQSRDFVGRRRLPRPSADALSA